MRARNIHAQVNRPRHEQNGLTERLQRSRARIDSERAHAMELAARHGGPSRSRSAGASVAPGYVEILTRRVGPRVLNIGRKPDRTPLYQRRTFRVDIILR